MATMTTSGATQAQEGEKDGPIKPSRPLPEITSKTAGDGLPSAIAEILAGRKWEAPPNDKRSADNIRAYRSFDRSIGKRYAQCRLENYTPECPKAAEILTEVARACADIVDLTDQGTNLVWIGTVGTGKDHLMTCAMRAALIAGKTVEWVNAASLWETCKACWGKQGHEVEDVLNPLIKADVLALSDPYPPDGQLDRHEKVWLYQLIDRRYRDMRPTWVTLNAKDAADAGAVLGAQVVDRLRDGAIVFECRWKSHRKAAVHGGVQ